MTEGIGSKSQPARTSTSLSGYMEYQLAAVRGWQRSGTPDPGILVASAIR